VHTVEGTEFAAQPTACDRAGLAGSCEVKTMKRDRIHHRIGILGTIPLL
jgi:hypothetical protein